MKIGGFMKQSFVDFPGNISAVIFTSGCNLNCWYCHNRQLIDGNEEVSWSFSQIMNFLNSRKGFLDGVVISGGEPTLQPDLLEVIKIIKANGFKVKLDTNGTHPEVLTQVLPFVDFVAMDIKTSLKNYHKTVCCEIDTSKIVESINLIKNSGCNYEFRTTFSPDITLEDVEDFAKMLKGVKRFALQTYKPQHENWPNQPLQNYNLALNILKKYIQNAFIR